MNKYQEAIEVIDTLLHLMCGEEREDGYKPTMEEMSNSMDWLKELVDKAESFEWIPFEMKDGFILCQIKVEDGFLHRQIPNVGEKILVTDGKRVWEDTWIEYDDGYALDSNYDLDEVTAWMPMPKAYKEKENDC